MTASLEINFVKLYQIMSKKIKLILHLPHHLLWHWIPTFLKQAIQVGYYLLWKSW